MKLLLIAVAAIALMYVGFQYVGGATPVENAVAQFGRERIAVPQLERSRRHDVGVAGKGEYRRGFAASRPQVGDVTEQHGFTTETDCAEAFDQHILAARIGGGNGGPCDKIAGQLVGCAAHAGSNISRYC